MAEVPTVNIIMSYDWVDILEFQEAMSLEDFGNRVGSKNTGTKQTYIFSNQPASNFLSLTHKYGFSQGGKQAAAPELSIEFIDPEGIFESSWFNLDASAMIPIDDDPLGSLLERKKLEIKGYKKLIDEVKNGNGKYASKLNEELEGGGFFTDGASLNALEATLESKIDEKNDLKDAKKDASDLDSDYTKKNLALIQKQIDANSNQLQRPMWITYGIGDQLADWSPVMCFDRCTNMEYSFTGGGARTLKLVYSGVGIHPNLTQMGLAPLKGFQLGLVFTGESYPMFNKKAFEVEKKIYEPLLKEVGSDYEPDIWKPSIHKVIRDAIRNFIKQAIGMNTNVLCILPDLDKYLAKEFEKRLKEVRASMKGWQSDKEDDWEKITSHIQATKEVLETCGLNFVEELNDKLQMAVGDNVWGRLENIEDPAKVMEWLQTKDLTAIISSDGVEESIQDKIKNIMEKIKEAVDNLGAIPDFAPYWYVECDFQMLEVMYKHFGGRDIKAGKKSQTGPMYESNSVGKPMSPVVVVGDKNTIMSYLQARILSKQSLDDKGNVMSFDSVAGQVAEVKKAVNEEINPYDRADGLTYEFMKDIFDISEPIPWLSPFGQSTGVGNEDDQYLPGDTNIPQNTLEQLKKEQPLSALRMPVFTLGTKNPNVLSLDIDINKQYYNSMNNFDMQNRTAQQYTTAIMGKGSEESQEVTEIFNAIDKLNLNNTDKNGIPIGFEAIVSPYWDANTRIGGWLHKAVGAGGGGSGGGEIDDLGGVETLFHTFGTDNDMPELVDPDGKDFDSKADMVSFMWKAFSAIGKTYKTKPKAKKQTSGKGVAGGKNSIMTAAKMAATLASKALLGTVTTLPMFHLSNDRRVLTRKVLLYCIEPRFAAGNSLFEEGTDNLKTNLIWFSGTYTMTGFEHTITKGSVQSSFAINRPEGGM